MGSICGSGAQSQSYSEKPIEALQPKKMSSKEDIKFSAGMFVRQNTKSFSNIYKLHDRPLGSGAYGEVWLCNHYLTNELRAVKILLKEGIPREDIINKTVLQEVDILKSLDHPNILKVFEYFEDQSQYCIVMEYCKGGDLFDKIQKLGNFSESQAARVMKQLLSALGYLHGKGVIHRDIKPENLLLCDTEDPTELYVKLIDFNIATMKKKNLEATGTIDYMAPEVFRGVYDEKCDVWGAGIILYVMISGGMPFSGDDDDQIARSIMNDKPNYNIGGWIGKSNELKELIGKMLMKNPRNRISAADALNHPWILTLAPSMVNQKTFSKTLNRMKSITKSSKLKEVFTTFIVSQISKTGATRKLEEVFHKLDINKDGVISVSEMVQELKKEMSEEEANREAERIIGAVDVDGSGQIDYTEFLRVSINEKKLLSKENLRKAFAYFDSDRSGSIEKSELAEWLSSGGIISDDIIMNLIDEADKDGDGNIDIEEFENILIEKLNI